MHTDCGFTPEQVRAMTLQDVHRLTKYWERFPPLRMLCAQYIGFKPVDPFARTDPSRYTSAEELGAMIDAGVFKGL